MGRHFLRNFVSILSKATIVGGYSGLRNRLSFDNAWRDLVNSFFVIRSSERRIFPTIIQHSQLPAEFLTSQQRASFNVSNAVDKYNLTHLNSPRTDYYTDRHEMR